MRLLASHFRGNAPGSCTVEVHLLENTLKALPWMEARSNHNQPTTTVFHYCFVSRTIISRREDLYWRVGQPETARYARTHLGETIARCFKSRLAGATRCSREGSSVATGVKLTPHYGGVGTKTSEFNPAFLEDRYRTVLTFRLKERQHEARENPEAASGC